MRGSRMNENFIQLLCDIGRGFVLKPRKKKEKLYLRKLKIVVTRDKLLALLNQEINRTRCGIEL